jgi:hypothetical protein
MMTIHLASVKKARAHLISGVSQDEQSRYWLAAGLLGIAYSFQSGWIGLQWTWAVLIDLVTSIAIVTIGIQECHRANGRAQGRDLILRLAVLGVPLGIRLWLITFIFYAINWYGFPYFMRTGLFANPERAWHFLTFILWNGTTALFWWRMHYHITVLSRLSNEAQSRADSPSLEAGRG